MIELIQKLNSVIINPLIALLIGVAALVFFWGIFVFITNSGNEEKQSEGRRTMMWGIIGLFIMFAVFGIIKLLLSSFGISDEPFRDVLP